MNKCDFCGRKNGHSKSCNFGGRNVKKVKELENRKKKLNKEKLASGKYQRPESGNRMIMTKK